MGRLLVSVIICLFAANVGHGDQPRTHDVTVHVSDVLIPADKNLSGDSYVVVSGMFPSSCYRWKGAEIENSSSTLHLIRVTAMVTEGMCLSVMVPYTKEVVLGRLVEGEHTLRFENGDGTYFERKMTVK